MAKSKLSPIQIVRRISLGFFLTLVSTLTILHSRLPGFPSIDGLCPFGGLETLYAYLAGGDLLKNIQPGNIVLMIAIVVLAIVLGRFFCGWICALGTLQGIFGWIGRKIFRRRYNLPAKADSVLRYLKYLVLALIIVFTWQAGSLVIRGIDPWAAYGHISAPWAELWAEFGIGLVILVLSLILSMFSDRVFCKYLCPMGAVQALLSRIPLFRLRRQTSTCTSCSLCSRACPMNIPVDKVDRVDSPECIGCYECVTSCPTKPKSLTAQIGGKVISLGWVILIGLGIYLGTIGVGRLLGMARFGPASLQEKVAVGELQIADIRGSTTWAEIATAFQVDLATLMRAAGIDPEKVPPATKLKDTGAISGQANFETDTARLALASMLGIEYAGETEEETGPKTMPQTPQSPTTSNSEALIVPSEFSLEGTMTIEEIATELKTSPIAIIQKLGLPKDIPQNRALRDLKDEFGFNMTELKSKIHQD
jgi:NAD-dependent dihydropyrimidine dehydrogenase PreA subunit